MSDAVFGAIRWPEIPNNIDPKVAQYLQEMQRAIDEFFGQCTSLPGDVAVGGYLYLMGADRIRTPVP